MSKATNENYRILKIVRDVFIILTCIILWISWLHSGAITIEFSMTDKVETTEPDSLNYNPNTHEKQPTRPQ